MQKIRRKGAVPVMEQRELDGMEYLVFPALEETGMVRHMFGTRVGGVSEGKYATPRSTSAIRWATARSVWMKITAGRPGF